MEKTVLNVVNGFTHRVGVYIRSHKDAMKSFIDSENALMLPEFLMHIKKVFPEEIDKLKEVGFKKGKKNIDCGCYDLSLNGQSLWAYILLGDNFN